jgi:hypothetical protein
VSALDAVICSGLNATSRVSTVVVWEWLKKTALYAAYAVVLAIKRASMTQLITSAGRFRHNLRTLPTRGLAVTFNLSNIDIPRIVTILTLNVVILLYPNSKIFFKMEAI